MLKTLTICLVLLVSAAWLAAQSTAQSPDTSSAGQGSSTSSQTGASSSSQGSSAQTGTSPANDTSIEGCLQGSSGNYTLTDHSGVSYALTGDTSKLAEHVGHEVKVKGSTSESGAGMGSTGAGMSGSTGSNTGASNGSSSSGSSSSLDVKSVKMVSKTCKNAGGK